MLHPKAAEHHAYRYLAAAMEAGLITGYEAPTAIRPTWVIYVDDDRGRGRYYASSVATVITTIAQLKFLAKMEADRRSAS